MELSVAVAFSAPVCTGGTRAFLPSRIFGPTPSLRGRVGFKGPKRKPRFGTRFPILTDYSNRRTARGNPIAIRRAQTIVVETCLHNMAVASHKNRTKAWLLNQHCPTPKISLLFIAQENLRFCCCCFLPPPLSGACMFFLGLELNIEVVPRTRNASTRRKKKKKKKLSLATKMKASQRNLRPQSVSTTETKIKQKYTQQTNKNIVPSITNLKFAPTRTQRVPGKLRPGLVRVLGDNRWKGCEYGEKQTCPKMVQWIPLGRPTILLSAKHHT